MFFKSCKILIYFTSLFLKSINCCMCIMQNSEKFFPYLQILSFLKNSPWKLKFSYIFRLSPICMNEEKWKKYWEIKLGLPIILEQCVQYKKMNQLHIFGSQAQNFWSVRHCVWCAMQCVTCSLNWVHKEIFSWLLFMCTGRGGSVL